MVQDIILIIGATACALCILISAIRTRKPVRTILLSALAGVVVLVILALATNMLAINAWTLVCAAAAGVPGVILMLVIRLIWGV